MATASVCYSVLTVKSSSTTVCSELIQEKVCSLPASWSGFLPKPHSQRLILYLDRMHLSGAGNEAITLGEWAEVQRNSTDCVRYVSTLWETGACCMSSLLCCKSWKMQPRNRAKKLHFLQHNICRLPDRTETKHTVKTKHLAKWYACWQNIAMHISFFRE